MCRASCKMFNIRREFFKVPFTIICIFGAVLMVGYWFYKFGIEDRDIGVVDYVSLDKTKDFKRPDFAICFSHFILVNKLIEANPNVTPAMYFHYLIGNNAYDQFLNIDYENVTLDLKNYLIKNMIKDSNGNFIRLNSYDLIHKTIFNGFHKNGFVKCFTTAIKQIEPLKDVEEFHLSYNKTKIFDDLGLPRDKILPIHTNVFYPGQFLLEVNRMKYHAMHGRKSGGANVFIQSIEMLKRRNSHNKKCHENGEFYDDMVIQKHVQSIGCRAPYIAKYQSFPICTNSLDVKNSKMDFYQTRKQYFLKACQRISKIQDAVVHFNNADGKWTLSVIYPDEIKIITQSKEVDGHTLVGNIGGYIGLFLGRYKKCIFFVNSITR